MGTLFVGQDAIFLPEVESTNSYAIALLKNVNLTEGAVIYSTNQTKGRGQRGNSWISGPGLNLAVSYVLKPTFLSIDKLYYMYIISALAVHDLMAEILDSSQFDIKIKWPNDILVNSKKIAGILNENFLNNTIANTTIVGIGINIGQEDFKGVENVTSLKLLGSKPSNVNDILKALSKHLENYYLKLKAQQFDTLLKNYYTHFYKKGELQTSSSMVRKKIYCKRY
ncbi:MAG: biotin--[acetyl-CoA-carboxylase] ligase [Sphingobacteriaceae bacterium]|nr:biotin--[acetyl-CoA-carboxylase] ligase [Sphingobacteriaceae bacterium]